MSWLLPTTADIPKVGKVRAVVDGGRTREALRAYNRAYYHAKRKANRKPQKHTPEQKERRRIQAAARYRANIEHMRALARANYWRHRDEYLKKARERARATARGRELEQVAAQQPTKENNDGTV